MEAGFFFQCCFHFRFAASQDDASLVTGDELDLAALIVARVCSRLRVHGQSRAIMKNISSTYLACSSLPYARLVIHKVSCCSLTFFIICANRL